MKKPILIIGIALVIAVAAAAYMFLPKADTYTESSDTPSTQVSAPTTNSDSQSSAQPNSKTTGQYVDYSQDIIASTNGTKVLFFHAPWCPQCRELDASIKKGPIPEGVTIIKVDYDTSQALRQKYGVTTQTTLVRVDDSGNIVKKYVAYNNPSLEALVQNAL